MPHSAPQPSRPDSSESPALRRDRSSGTAREVKFRAEADRLDELTRLLDARLERDPHGEPALDGDYRVRSLYCDTDDLEVFRRIGWHRVRKFRVRRYGASELAYLERKTRLGDLVRKDRTEIPLGDVAQLDHRLAAAAGWAGHDFRRQLARRGLRPTCTIEYRRRAFYGSIASAVGPLPIRVTIDREVAGAAIVGWSFDAERLSPLLGGLMIVEIKFAGDSGGVPVAAKDLISDLRLTLRGVSKYRQCMRLLQGLGDAAAMDASARDEDPNDA